MLATSGDIHLMVRISIKESSNIISNPSRRRTTKISPMIKEPYNNSREKLKKSK
jgi:hypothetical protein